ncbi:MAG: methyltransferase domain-containing protein [Candidatus Methanoplasma sp.]|jgi:nucleoside phosphorylase/SAM-dependent methyltransferase|nr:methyltransferase domain-containing protein [Candidatus Methanoplasma sp.]
MANDKSDAHGRKTLTKPEAESLKQEIKILFLAHNQLEHNAFMGELEPIDGEIWSYRERVQMYYIGMIKGHKVVYTRIGESGNTGVNSSINVVGMSVELWEPESVIMVGVAASMKDGIDLGDVVIANCATGYERIKQFNGRAMDRNPKHVPRGLYNSAAIDEAYEFNRYSGTPAKDQPVWSTFKVHVGVVLSGEMLLNDANRKEELQRNYPDALALEMESIGVASACTAHGISDWTIIKGISDAGQGKTNRYQPPAMKNVMTFVKTVLEKVSTGKELENTSSVRPNMSEEKVQPNYPDGNPWIYIVCEQNDKEAVELKTKIKIKFPHNDVILSCDQDGSKDTITRCASVIVIITPNIKTSQFTKVIVGILERSKFPSETCPYYIICTPDKPGDGGDQYLEPLESLPMPKVLVSEKVLKEKHDCVLDLITKRITSTSEPKRQFEYGCDAYKYYNFEKGRIENQRKLLKEFRKDLYKRTEHLVNDGYNVLDLGCFNGAQIVDQYGKGENYERLGKIIGVDREKSAVDDAVKEFESNKVKFYNLDIESVDFEKNLRKICSEEKIDNCQFDIINLSMVLLHLKRQNKLLGLLKDFLKDDGIMIICDVDDTYTHVDPDNNRWFRDAKTMCSEFCSRYYIGGLRYGGSAIAKKCRDCGYSETDVVKIGLGLYEVIKTAPKDGIECPQSTFFDMYFGFIYHDMEILYNDPVRYISEKSEREKLKNKYEELLEHYYDMRLEVFKPGFWFTIGYILLAVKK